MSYILESALDPQRKAQADAADAAHAALLGALAHKAMQPRRFLVADVAQRPGFDPDFGVYTGNAADPRTPEPLDGELLPFEAHDMAVAELLTTAEPAADWIAKACDCPQGRQPIPALHVGALTILETDSVPLLMALILNGTSQQRAQASDRLAALYMRAEGEWIGQRSAELIAANRVELGL